MTGSIVRLLLTYNLIYEHLPGIFSVFSLQWEPKDWSWYFFSHTNPTDWVSWWELYLCSFLILTIVERLFMVLLMPGLRGSEHSLLCPLRAFCLHLKRNSSGTELFRSLFLFLFTPLSKKKKKSSKPDLPVKLNNARGTPLRNTLFYSRLKDKSCFIHAFLLSSASFLPWNFLFKEKTKKKQKHLKPNALYIYIYIYIYIRERGGLMTNPKVRKFLNGKLQFSEINLMILIIIVT